MRCARLFLLLLVAASTQLTQADPSSPNLLRNTRFLQCANPGVPDWWGTGAPENIQNWKGCYGTEKDAPLSGLLSLRLTSPANRARFDSGGPGLSVQSYAYSLPAGRDYTYSIYLKAHEDGVKANLAVGDQSKSLAVTRDWQRYVMTAKPKQGHWAAGRLVVTFGLATPGTLWVAAPQLEYGDKATDYRPAEADLMAGTKAAAGPSIPPHPLPLPSARCPRTLSPPIIDGKLDDACYQNASRLSDFRDMTTGDLSQVQTECYLLRDDTNLFIAFRCHEPEMKDLVAKVTTRDGAVFTDDSIEVFLQPDPKSPDYLHFAVNALGAQFDEKQFDSSWNAKWQVAVGKGDSEWTVEMAIPFASLGLTPRTAETWRANFCRNRPHGGSPNSEWSCTYVGFHVPSRFGKLSGFSRKDLQAYYAEPPKQVTPVVPPPSAPLDATFELSYYTSESNARLWVKSNLDVKAHVEVELRSRTSGESRKLSLTATPMKSSSAAVDPKSSRYIPFDITHLEEGEYDVSVTAIDAQGAELARTQTTLIKLPPSSVEVKMHRVNRSLMVNGKPFLVYAQGIHGRRGGWWLDDIKSHGFNTVIGFCDAYRSEEQLNKDEPKVREFLDECQSKGLKVVLWFAIGGGEYLPMREAVVRSMKRFKDHPAILCWYLVDEPEGWWSGQEGGKKEADLLDLCRAAKAADPYRPAHINWYAWSKGRGGYGTLDATDIGSLDRYPVGRGVNAIKVTGDITNLMNEDCRLRHQPTAFWVQMYGYDDAVREPTSEEMKGMTYVCLIDGMRLIYYFIYKPMSVDLWESMTALGDELHALEPVMSDPEAQELAVGIEKGVVHYCLWQSKSKDYLIAVNASDDQTKVTFDLKGMAGIGKPLTPKVWFEKQTVKCRAGKLQLTLKPNQRIVVELAR